MGQIKFTKQMTVPLLCLWLGNVTFGGQPLKRCPRNSHRVKALGVWRAGDYEVERLRQAARLLLPCTAST
jgi:hypothetical protein